MNEDGNGDSGMTFFNIFENETTLKKISFSLCYAHLGKDKIV